jgi:formiminoglutamase
MSRSGDPRLADIIQTPTEKQLDSADVVIFGVPTDEGIIRNGGRPGAALAPDEIRKYLHKLTPFSDEVSTLESLSIVDLGNVSATTLEEMHGNARELTTRLITGGKIVIALGGGHDVTYPLAAGFSKAMSGTPWSLVNVDAHLDVRPKKNGLHHSGSSFRLLIEEGHLPGDRFTELGIQSFAFSREHYEWAMDQGASIMLYDDVSNVVVASAATLASEQQMHYLSFDIDCVRSSDAPGCSAPSPIGLTAYEACAIARIAGTHRTTMFDIVEVSPPHDIDSRTSRLAARMIAYFLAGIAESKRAKL